MSVDGPKFDANASKHRLVTYEGAGELVDHLELEIADLMGRAEATHGPGEEDPQALPKEIVRRKALRDRLVAARRCLKTQAKARAETGIEALVATGAEGRRRRYDFRPAKAKEPPKAPKAGWLMAMATKLQSQENRTLYRLRQQTVEPVFGIIKNVLGFTRFSLRGLDKVGSEWELVVLAYNCKRLYRLKLEMAS